MREIINHLFRIRGPLILSTVLLVAVGCTHTVKYKLTEEDRWIGPKTDQVLCLVPLIDKTSTNTERRLSVGSDVWRTNHRGRYENKEIAKGVTAMVAKHLDHSRLFKKVVVGTNVQESDLLLRGDISDYSSMAKINSTAEGITAGTAGFGLIGAIVGSATTSGSKTEVKSRVELGNVELRRSNPSTLIWSGTVVSSTNFAAHWRNAEEPVVFAHADDSLKRAVSELVRKLGKSLTSTNSQGASLSVPVVRPQ